MQPPMHLEIEGADHVGNRRSASIHKARRKEEAQDAARQRRDHTMPGAGELCLRNHPGKKRYRGTLKTGNQLWEY